MLENNKCILAYGLSNVELDKLKSLKHKVIEITPDMCKMKLNDILKGLRICIANENPIKDKMILYNNFSENEIKSVIKETRNCVKDGVLAIVTPTSIEWEVEYLIKHLIEERDFYLKSRKG